MHSKHPIDRIIHWVGSLSSLIVHTLMFILFFIIASLGFVSWSLMLLILTTIVSLEAIYMSIFIQMTVNRQAMSLREVEEDIDEIQEDVEDIQEDIEEISEEESEALEGEPTAL